MSTNPSNTISQPGAEERDPSDYKPQLDEIAEQKRKSPEEQQSQEREGSGLVEKISEYVPESVGEKIGLRKSPQQQSAKAAPKEQEPKEDLSAVPPHRPHHDEQIQEFLRDQHRSKEILGDDEDTKGI